MNFAADPEACRLHINEFIAKTTNNHLTDVLQPSDISTHSNFVIANAAYFQADWSFPFPMESTTKAMFNGLNGPVEVSMMNQEEHFSVGKCVEKTYFYQDSTLRHT